MPRASCFAHFLIVLEKSQYSITISRSKFETLQDLKFFAAKLVDPKQCPNKQRREHFHNVRNVSLTNSPWRFNYLLSTSSVDKHSCRDSWQHRAVSFTTALTALDLNLTLGKPVLCILHHYARMGPHVLSQAPFSSASW